MVEPEEAAAEALRAKTRAEGGLNRVDAALRKLLDRHARDGEMNASAAAAAAASRGDVASLARLSCGEAPRVRFLESQDERRARDEAAGTGRRPAALSPSSPETDSVTRSWTLSGVVSAELSIKEAARQNEANVETASHLCAAESAAAAGREVCDNVGVGHFALVGTRCVERNLAPRSGADDDATRRRTCSCPNPVLVARRNDHRVGAMLASVPIDATMRSRQMYNRGGGNRLLPARVRAQSKKRATVPTEPSELTLRQRQKREGAIAAAARPPSWRARMQQKVATAIKRFGHRCARVSSAVTRWLVDFFLTDGLDAAEAARASQTAKEAVDVARKGAQQASFGRRSSERPGSFGANSFDSFKGSFRGAGRAIGQLKQGVSASGAPPTQSQKSCSVLESALNEDDLELGPRSSLAATPARPRRCAPIISPILFICRCLTRGLICLVRLAVVPRARDGGLGSKATAIAACAFGAQPEHSSAARTSASAAKSPKRTVQVLARLRSARERGRSRQGGVRVEDDLDLSAFGRGLTEYAPDVRQAMLSIGAPADSGAHYPGYACSLRAPAAAKVSPSPCARSVPFSSTRGSCAPTEATCTSSDVDRSVKLRREAVKNRSLGMELRELTEELAELREEANQRHPLKGSFKQQHLLLNATATLSAGASSSFTDSGQLSKRIHSVERRLQEVVVLIAAQAVKARHEETDLETDDYLAKLKLSRPAGGEAKAASSLRRDSKWSMVRHVAPMAASAAREAADIVSDAHERALIAKQHRRHRWHALIVRLPTVFALALVAGCGVATAAFSLWVQPDGAVPTAWLTALGAALAFSWLVVEPLVLARGHAKRQAQDRARYQRDRQAEAVAAEEERLALRDRAVSKAAARMGNVESGAVSYFEGLSVPSPARPKSLAPRITDRASSDAMVSARPRPADEDERFDWGAVGSSHGDGSSLVVRSADGSDDSECYSNSGSSYRRAMLKSPDGSQYSSCTYHSRASYYGNHARYSGDEDSYGLSSVRTIASTASSDSFTSISSPVSSGRKRPGHPRRGRYTYSA